MDAYYQGMRAQRKLSRMGFKGHRSGKGKGKGKGMSKGKLSLPTGSSDRAGLDARKRSGTCRDCGGKGHWRGDSECPKVKSGETKRFGTRPKGKGADVCHFWCYRCWWRMGTGNPRISETVTGSGTELTRPRCAQGESGCSDSEYRFQTEDGLERN